MSQVIFLEHSLPIQQAWSYFSHAQGKGIHPKAGKGSDLLFQGGFGAKTKVSPQLQIILWKPTNQGFIWFSEKIAHIQALETYLAC